MTEPSQNTVTAGDPGTLLTDEEIIEHLRWQGVSEEEIIKALRSTEIQKP